MTFGGHIVYFTTRAKNKQNDPTEIHVINIIINIQGKIIINICNI